jgi:hypothetical protein
MDIVTVILILLCWLAATFIPSYKKAFKNATSPNQVKRSLSSVQMLFAIPAFFTGMLFFYATLKNEAAEAILFGSLLVLLLLGIAHSLYWRKKYITAKLQSLTKAKKYFDQFPWGEVDHAYGVATDSPYYLMELIINHEDEDNRENAVYDFLYARPWHQWDVYSSTPYAASCVIYIIKNVDVSDLSIDETSLLYHLFSFLNICTHGAKSFEALKKVIIDDEPLYQSFVNHPEKLVREQVSELLSFCELQKHKLDDGKSQ